jgi:hypothetical protein
MPVRAGDGRAHRGLRKISFVRNVRPLPLRNSAHPTLSLAIPPHQRPHRRVDRVRRPGRPGLEPGRTELHPHPTLRATIQLRPDHIPPRPLPAPHQLLRHPQFRPGRRPLPRHDPDRLRSSPAGPRRPTVQPESRHRCHLQSLRPRRPPDVALSRPEPSRRGETCSTTHVACSAHASRRSGGESTTDAHDRSKFSRVCGEPVRDQTGPCRTRPASLVRAPVYRRWCRW